MVLEAPSEPLTSLHSTDDRRVPWSHGAIRQSVEITGIPNVPPPVVDSPPVLWRSLSAHFEATNLASSKIKISPSLKGELTLSILIFLSQSE